MKFFYPKIYSKSSAKIWRTDFTNRVLFFEELDLESFILLPWTIKMDWVMGMVILSNFIEDNKLLNKGGDLKKKEES